MEEKREGEEKEKRLTMGASSTRPAGPSGGATDRVFPNLGLTLTATLAATGGLVIHRPLGKESQQEEERRKRKKKRRVIFSRSKRPH